MFQTEPTGTNPRRTSQSLARSLAVGLAAFVAFGCPWGLPAQEAGEPSSPPPSSLQRVRELTQPRPAPTPGQTPSAGSTVRVGEQFIRYGNPVRLGQGVVQGYQNREFLSTHGTVHANPGDAMLHSMAPVRGPANTRAAVRGALDPTNVVLSFGLPVAQEMVRQMIDDRRVDPATLAQRVKPAALGGSFAGGVAGTAAGAAVQSVLAGFGPVGVAAGFVARPLIAWGGGLYGANLAENAAHGNLSPGDAFRQSVASIQPGRDLGSVLGGTVGMVVGQALIPIPGVGGFVGSIAGTLIGGWLGSKLLHEEPPDPRDKLLQQGVKGLTGKTNLPQVDVPDFNPVGGLGSAGRP